MREYEDYIKELKKVSAEPDFDLLRKRIKTRAGQIKARSRLAAAGALVVFIMAATASFFYLPLLTGGGGEVLLSYVFEPAGSLDGPILDYVLGE
jgi:hypothetical protein